MEGEKVYTYRRMVKLKAYEYIYRLRMVKALADVPLRSLDGRR